MTQVIVRNDGLDSDNMGTFMTTVKWASATSGAKLVVIYEPRLVDFSLKILKPDDRDHLDNLLKLHFAKYGKPLKICLNGLLSHEEINKLTNVSREDKDLLRMAVNPSNDLEGPKQHDSLEDRRVDSRLHASLVARDLARCLEELLKASNRQAEVTILVDMDALQDTGPVNLKCHDPEQLFNRTPQDIREFWRSMDQPEKSRREKLREWCKARIEEADKEPQNSTILVKNLDYCDLTNRIKATEGVTFIEGASFHLLRRLIDDPEVAAKIDCVVQAGTLEASNNIFTNQFNIALDRESAEHVLQNTTLFRSFVAIPTQTSLSIPFSFGNLEEKGFSTLARWILCFNRREDPLKVAEGNVTLAGKAASQGGPVTVTIKLPDLAMVLLAFDPEKYPRETSRVEVQMQGESLLFVESERGIPIFLPKGGHTYKAVDLAELLTSEVEGSFRINWGT